MNDLPPDANVTIGCSPELGALAGALAKAQMEMGTAKKNATNPHFKSKYADLESIMGCRPEAARQERHRADF
jgi:hypothetical protein